MLLLIIIIIDKIDHFTIAETAIDTCLLDSLVAWERPDVVSCVEGVGLIIM